MLERDVDAAVDLGERVPYPLPQDDDTTLQQWLAELQVEANDIDAAVDAVLDSFQPYAASGQALDELGRDFGELGRRRGRDDEQYRSFLLGLVAAFDGRGTVPGVETAIAAGVLTTSDDVSLTEDFDTQQYEVTLENESWSAHKSGTVRDLADLADPSVVGLRDPVHNILKKTSVGIKAGEVSSGEMYRSPETVVGIDPGGTTSELWSIGLSAPTLGALSTDSWLLSIRRAPAATVGIAPGDTIIRSMTTASVAAVQVDAGNTVVRLMTRTSTASVGVSPSPVDATTLTTRGLSSGLLGGLSTTSIDQLA